MRAEYIEILKDSYGHYYDLRQLEAEKYLSLLLYAEIRSGNQICFLFKNAKLWSMESWVM